MFRFEYKRVSVTLHEPCLKIINEHGDDGWELVQVRRITSDVVPYDEMFFKRAI